MNRHRKGQRRRRQVIHAWTHNQIRRALPYVVSIARSLREHRLDAQRYQLAATRLANLPGRPDRDRILSQEFALQEAREAEDRFREALLEMETLDVECLDPILGLALIPFAKNNDLAWFVFELFEKDPLRYWRFHKDPLQTRRPIAELGGELN